jgi:hypothetical protein
MPLKTVMRIIEEEFGITHLLLLGVLGALLIWEVEKEGVFSEFVDAEDTEDACRTR